MAEPFGPGEERKLVTVLFADVAGSTGLGERLDPERLKEIMSSFFEAMRSEIEAEGGTVEKFIGDAVMAVFGVPVAHEDDPARALRAAGNMRQRLGELNQTLEQLHGVTLAMRIGVNTGDVVTSPSPRPAEGMVTGDAVNVAARLEQSAGSGQILLSERTARAARGHTLGEIGRLNLKGKEEAVRAFELLEVAPVRGAEERDVHLAPMIGREREMEVLQTLHQRVVAEGHPHLVTIYGEAGVGKSRLVDEFASWASGLDEPSGVVQGRCLPYGEGIAYWPLAEILRRHAGVESDDPPELALQRIRDAIQGLLAEAAGSGRDLTTEVPALAYALGLEDPGKPMSETEPRQVRAQTVSAWRGYFSALARRGPMVVVIEDIHWADLSLLDILEDIAERAEGALLFLCPSRPELTARRPGWGGGRWNFSAMLIDPLEPGDAERLLDHLLLAEEVSEGVRAQMLERGGGNPFFLEEIVRHLMDERRAVAAEEGWRAAMDFEEVDIPDTVQGVLSARLDLLGSEEKRVLQSAAVVGRTFWTEPAGILLGPDLQTNDVEEILGRLQDRGLVLSRLGSTMAGEREYAFRHVLTRDVAYGSLPLRDRATAHAEVAAWIEERAGDRQREFAELLAHHYSEAHRGIREDVQADRSRVEELRAKAFQYSLLASQDVRSKLVLDKAESHAEAALALAVDEVDRSQALEVLGQTYLQDSRGDLAWECLKEATDLRRDWGGSDPASQVRLCAAALEIPTRARGTMRSLVTREEAAPYLELALSLAGNEDSPELARLLTVKAFWPFAFVSGATEDEWDQAQAAGAEAEAMALRLARPDLASAALDAIGSYYDSRGLYGPLGAVVRRRLNLVPSITDLMEVGDIHAMASWWAFHSGLYREGEEFADRGFEAVRQSSPIMALYCLDWRAMARCRLGDWDGFFADIELFREMLGGRREAAPGFAADHVAAAAFIHQVRGDEAAANHQLQILAWLERTEKHPEPGWAVWRALLLARRGEFDEAHTEMERPEIVSQGYGRGHLLEARCDLVAEEASWDRVKDVVEEAHQHAEWAGLVALPHFADRLDGRAALEGGDHDRAVELLEAATSGFDGIEARWEAAVSRLDLARAHTRAGHDQDARRELASAVPVLDALRSLRELVRAGELLDGLR